MAEVSDLIIRLRAWGAKKTTNQLEKMDQRLSNLASTSKTMGNLYSKSLEKSNQATKKEGKVIGRRLELESKRQFQLGKTNARMIDSTRHAKNFMKEMKDVSPQRDFNKEMKNAGLRMGQFNKVAKRQGWVLTDQGEVWDNWNKRIVSHGEALNQTSRDARRFKMEWLSMLFFSMNASRQLQRVMMSSTAALTKIAGENNEAAQAVSTLSAQFTFLKFTIGDAIGTVLTPLLPMIETIVNLVADFIQQHPEEVVYGLVGSFMLFKGLNIAAQIALISIWFSTMADKIALATTKLAILKGMAGVIGIAVSLYFVYRGIKDIISGMKEGDWKKVIRGILATALAGAATGAFIAIVAGASIASGLLIGAIVGLGIGLIITFFMAAEPDDEEVRKAGKKLRDQWRGPTMGGTAMTGEVPFSLGTENLPEFVSQNLTETNKIAKPKMEEFKTNWTDNTTAMQTHWEEISIGKNDSIVANWTNMIYQNEKKAREYVEEVNREFDNIPRNITTIHTIRRNYTGGGLLGSFQSGTDYVPQTGPYLLHKGEAVVPANKNISNSVNVNMNGSNLNANDVANMIANKLNNELRRFI